MSAGDGDSADQHIRGVAGVSWLRWESQREGKAQEILEIIHLNTGHGLIDPVCV